MTGSGAHRPLQTSPLATGLPTLLKAEHVLTRATFKKFFRLAGWCKEQGMTAFCRCGLCHDEVQMLATPSVQLTDGASSAPALRLECACSRWIIR
jgi:hypothetical protein